VKLLRDEFMRKVNATHQPSAEDMRIADFWEQRYLPFVQTNMKASRVPGVFANLESAPQTTFR